MSARRSQAALAIARKKNRAQASSSSSVQYHAPTRVTVAGYSAQDDSVNFMQIDPEAAAEPVDDIWNRFKKKDKINLLMIKTLDLLLSLYIVGYISYSIYLNSILLLSQVSSIHDSDILISETIRLAPVEFNDIFKAEHCVVNQVNKSSLLAPVND